MEEVSTTVGYKVLTICGYVIKTIDRRVIITRRKNDKTPALGKCQEH